jgi:hypothetical protein
MKYFFGIIIFFNIIIYILNIIMNIIKEYGIFDWNKYILSNADLKYLKTNKEAFQHFTENGINEERLFYFRIEKNIRYEFFNLQKYVNNKNLTNKNLTNKNLTKHEGWKLWNIEPNKKDMDVFDNTKLNSLKVPYNDFDWISYLTINKDIYNSGINTKVKSWEHWKKYGITEERAFSYVNNSNIHNGRFGNLFFLNMFLHFFSKKYDLLCNYKYFDKFSQLGIELYVGTKTYDTNLLVTDTNFLLFLYDTINFQPSNIIIHNDIWFQKKEFCLYLEIYFNNSINKNKIILKNIFKERYNNNNDLFIHFRLGDVESNTTKLFEYYDNLLKTISFENGYISSDSIDSKYCEYFIKKYKLNIINYDEIKTIMFGSTCNHVVLSGGTFSWLIGFFSFYSENVYYPLYENPWFGNIFETNSKWICINPKLK